MNKQGKANCDKQDDPWQVKADHTNEFVYNTEAHPIRIFGGRETLG